MLHNLFAEVQRLFISLSLNIPDLSRKSVISEFINKKVLTNNMIINCTSIYKTARYARLVYQTKNKTCFTFKMRNWRFSIPQCRRIDFFTTSMLSSEVRKNLMSVEVFPFTVRSSHVIATALSPDHSSLFSSHDRFVQWYSCLFSFRPWSGLHSFSLYITPFSEPSSSAELNNFLNLRSVPGSRIKKSTPMRILFCASREFWRIVFLIIKRSLHFCQNSKIKFCLNSRSDSLQGKRIIKNIFIKVGARE